MTKTMDKWRELGVQSAYILVKRYAGLTGKIGVYASYSNNDGSRMSMGRLDGYHVVRPGYKTDPDGHWTNNGNMAFSKFRADGYPGALAQAKEWANQRYGYGDEDWVPITGFGCDRFPKRIADWAKKYLKENS